MIALAGVTVSIALGASIPIEALCGLPGIVNWPGRRRFPETFPCW